MSSSDSNESFGKRTSRTGWYTQLKEASHKLSGASSLSHTSEKQAVVKNNYTTTRNWASAWPGKRARLCARHELCDMMGAAGSVMGHWGPDWAVCMREGGKKKRERGTKNSSANWLFSVQIKKNGMKSKFCPMRGVLNPKPPACSLTRSLPRPNCANVAFF